MRSITNIPSGEISARTTSKPMSGAVRDNCITSSRFMRIVPFTLVAPFPFKSTAIDIFAVKASHAGARLRTSVIYSVSERLPIDTLFFMLLVEEQEETSVNNTAPNK